MGQYVCTHYWAVPTPLRKKAPARAGAFPAKERSGGLEADARRDPVSAGLLIGGDAGGGAEARREGELGRGGEGVESRRRNRRIDPDVGRDRLIVEDVDDLRLDEELDESA